MNIAIVDNEKIELETAEALLRFYVKKFWADCESRIHIETFYNAKVFLTFFSPKFYQLVILGGHMKKIANLIYSTNIKILFLKSDCEEDL